MLPVATYLQRSGQVITSSRKPGQAAMRPLYGNSGEELSRRAGKCQAGVWCSPPGPVRMLGVATTSGLIIWTRAEQAMCYVARLPEPTNPAKRGPLEKDGSTLGKPGGRGGGGPCGQIWCTRKWRAAMGDNVTQRSDRLRFRSGV